MSNPNDVVSHVFATLPSLAILATHYWELTSGQVTDAAHKLTSLAAVHPDMLHWSR